LAFCLARQPGGVRVRSTGGDVISGTDESADAQGFRLSSRTRTLRALGICAIVAAIWAVAAARWIATDSVVPWDSKNQFYAFFRFLANALHAGQSPFWNPFHYGGHPAVADPQSLIFAPAFFVWALFDDAPSMRVFDLVVYAHLLAGGIAMALIGLRARWPAAACVLAAAIFMFGGAASGRLQHTGIILSYGLFPVALLFLQIALDRRSILWSILFACVAAAMVLGRNQVAMLLALALAAFAMAQIATAPRPLTYLRERLPAIAVMTLVGFALIALPMLLTLQFAALSNRPAVTLGEAMQGSLHPANLATLGVANIFGSHGADYWGPNWRLPELPFTDQSFNYMFVGAVPVLLLFWFGIAGGGAFRRGRILFAAMLALALLFMLGRYTPAFAVMFDWIPGMHFFRRPVDANFVVVAALALLCGHLLTDFVRRGLPRVSASGFAAATALALMALAAAVSFSGRYGKSDAALMEFLKVLPAFAAVAALIALSRTRPARRHAAMLLAAIAVAELLWWNAASRLNAESRAIYAVLESPAPDDAKAIAMLDEALAAHHREGDYPRVEVIGVGSEWQNLAMVRGWEATNGYNPLRIGFYDRLVSPGEATYASPLRRFPNSFDGYDCSLARALGLEYLVLGRPIEEMPRLQKRPVADVLVQGPKVWIYRLHHRAPRIKFTARVQVADADATAAGGQLLVNPANGRVLIDDDTPPERSYLAGAAFAGSAQIVSWEPGRTAVDVDSKQGGVLVLNGTYYPGWIAEIDGLAAPLMRADVLFRGVEVPPGNHRVVFRFAPFSRANLWDAMEVIRGE
jgi:hypothetical protein